MSASLLKYSPFYDGPPVSTITNEGSAIFIPLLGVFLTCTSSPRKRVLRKGVVHVTPAQAGVQNQRELKGFIDSRLRGNDNFETFATPPARE